MIRQRFGQFIGAVVVTAFVAGCGGGGGESSAPDSAAPAPAPTPTPTPTPAPPVGTTPVGAAAIEVPEGFDFATSKLLPVTVTRSAAAPSKAYLAICQSDAAGVDYDRCLLRTALDGGRYDGELLLPNHIDSLAATVWAFDPAEVVHAAVWERPEGDLGVLRIQ